MPKLIGLYKKHKDKRDKFEIIAMHDDSVKSIEELNQEIAKMKLEWDALPFPVLIDRKGETTRAWGINAWPTLIAIDPEGKIHGEIGEYQITKILKQMK